VSVRRNLITGEPMLFAPERSNRPGAFDEGPPEACPFCAGNESHTPPEIDRAGDARRWTVRVFPNKYPASEHHEVIVESPEHGDTFATIPDPEAAVRVYRDRYADVASRAGVAYVCVFKNHGPRAGASIDHVHSQLLATSFVPPRIERESAAFAAARTCLLCEAIERHRGEGLLIDESDSFARIAPSASAMAYQQWVIPKAHRPEMAEMSDGEAAQLATLLQKSAAGMQRISPSYNWMFLNFPRAARGHWYLDLFPRRGSVAGFELGTGTWIEIVDPERTAEVMRS
jgi:UDPglucose--hexose-1-phosphate uridylyltransferase